jgi:hypothetical protein
MKSMFLACALGALSMLSPAHGAPESGTKQLTLAPLDSVALEGVIKGAQTAQYQVRTSGQGALSIHLVPSSSSTYFNVSQAGAIEALHVGSRDGDTFTHESGEAGEYTVTVYLMRNAARRNTVSRYSLRLSESR